MIQILNQRLKVDIYHQQVLTMDSSYHVHLELKIDRLISLIQINV